MPAILGIGEDGGYPTDSTDPQTGRWMAFTALTDTVFSAMTIDGSAVAPVGSAISAYTFPKGVTIRLQLTSYTLSSGTIWLYNQS